MKKYFVDFFTLMLVSLPAFSAEEKALSEAEKLLIDSIKATKEMVGHGIDFAKDQLPDLIQQLLVYNTVLLSGAVLMGLGLIIASVYLLKMFNVEHNKSYHDCDGLMMGIYIIFSFLSGVFGAMTFFSSLPSLLKITLAPKIWLLEYAANLVK